MMNSFEENFTLAKKLHMSGKIKAAQEIYAKIINIKDDNFLIFSLYATTFLQLKKFSEAIKYFSISINLNPNFADSYNNRGIAHAEQKNYMMAIEDYDKAINLKKEYFDAHLNKAIALKNCKKFDKAIFCFDACIKINPREFKIYINLGNLYAVINKYDEALRTYEKAISLNKNNAEVYSNRGDVNLKLKKYDSALNDYKNAFKLNKDLDNIFGKYVHTEMKINKWDNFYKHNEYLKKVVKKGEKTINPFDLLSLIDEPELHKKAAIKYSKLNCPEITKHKKNLEKKDKIKIGYFSADFKNHAVLYLMIDVFKNHNKSNFEIYGFNHSNRKDKITSLVSKYFDKFFDCSNLSDEEIATLSKKNGINIAINLTGHTADSRDGIYQYNPAPIKVNYLGYPGTLGSSCYNFIIADRVVIPEKEKNNYCEDVIYLPECYQPNQAKVLPSKKKNSKKENGLPENSFVFGCLNNNYKITPDIFNSWMKILNKTENSVLWLLIDEVFAKRNIEKEANKHGIDSNRIIYASKVPSKMHLERLKCIDLFLDTFPYNAHTTAKEAIRVGVPIITIIGNSFASRVASSILATVGLEELITRNIKEYTKLAINLRNNNSKLEKIKIYLSQPKIIAKIHDCKKFTRDLEGIYIEMIKRVYSWS